MRYGMWENSYTRGQKKKITEGLEQRVKAMESSITFYSLLGLV
jgi:hypothetical protein